VEKVVEGRRLPIVGSAGFIKNIFEAVCAERSQGNSEKENGGSEAGFRGISHKKGRVKFPWRSTFLYMQRPAFAGPVYTCLFVLRRIGFVLYGTPLKGVYEATLPEL
jgi:hypothetical protein